MARKKKNTAEESLADELARDDKGVGMFIRPQPFDISFTDEPKSTAYPTDEEILRDSPSSLKWPKNICHIDPKILHAVIERLEMAYRISRERKVNEILFAQIEELKKLI